VQLGQNKVFKLWEQVSTGDEEICKRIRFTVADVKNSRHRGHFVIFPVQSLQKVCPQLIIRGRCIGLEYLL
jgi:hypothetical protein